MGLEISRPVMPNDPGKIDPSKPEDAQKQRDYDRQMMAYQDDMARYNRTLQQMQGQQQEEAATRSTMEKNKHDAVMQIVANMKG